MDKNSFSLVVSHKEHTVHTIQNNPSTNLSILDSKTDGENGFTELAGAWDLISLTINEIPYAIVTSYADDGIQIIEIQTSIPSKIKNEEDKSLIDLKKKRIPDWVKNVFSWYSEDKVSENEVLNAIKFLINKEIIILNSN